ncbi:MAG: CBS domain-containing protein [Candidatus Odinarchaeota archaeon]
MSSDGESKDVVVRDVMTKNVLRAKGSIPLTVCAKLMLSYQVGSIIIDSDKILTKTDILRAIGEGDLGLITAAEIASSPLIICFPDDNLEDTMQKMSQKRIEKLVVLEKDNIVGIISSTDILKAAPGLFEIKREQWLMNNGISPSSIIPEQDIEGYCEDCGNYTDILMNFDGTLLCKECFETSEKKEIEEDEEETF